MHLGPIVYCPKTVLLRKPFDLKDPLLKNHLLLPDVSPAACNLTAPRRQVQGSVLLAGRHGRRHYLHLGAAPEAGQQVRRPPRGEQAQAAAADTGGRMSWWWCMCVSH